MGGAIRSRAAGASELLLWVADAGVGISSADQEMIFKRFGRGGNGERTQGSGLGLNIVAAIAEAHGGEIRVESTLGAGSIFILSVPLTSDTHATALRDQSGPDSAGTLEPSRFDHQESASEQNPHY